jgi:hypothetical protein
MCQGGDLVIIDFLVSILECVDQLVRLVLGPETRATGTKVFESEILLFINL